MAPVTRSRKRKRSEPSIAINTNRSHTTVENNCAFLSLPDELHLKIAECLPSMPVGQDIYGEGVSFDKEWDDYAKRRYAMEALSQTSQSLRRIFLSIAWERIEVLEGGMNREGILPILGIARRKSDSSIFKFKRILHEGSLDEELLRQLSLATFLNPSLAKYVKIVNVVLTDNARKTINFELARCLSMLPNVHTIQVAAGSLMPNGFKGYKYENVRRIHCSNSKIMFNLLQVCPNARQVSMYLIPRMSYQSYGLSLSKSAIARFRKLGTVESLRNVTVYGIRDTNALAESFPNLREISFLVSYFPREYDFLDPLSRLKRLQTIVVYAAGSLTMDAFILHCEQVLFDKSRNSTAEKKLVIYRPGYGCTTTFGRSIGPPSKTFNIAYQRHDTA